MVWNQKKKWSIRLAGVSVGLAFAVMLGGCMPSYVDEQEAKKVTDEAKKQMEAFLASNQISAQIDDLKVVSGTSIDQGVGTYMTFFARGTFEANDQTYQIACDTERDIIYTDYHMDLLNAYIKNSIEETLKANDMTITVPYEVTNVNFEQNFTSEHVPVSSKSNVSETTSLLSLSAMLPESITSEEALETYLSDHAEDMEFHALDLFYSSEEKELFLNNTLETLVDQTDFYRIDAHNIGASDFAELTQSGILPFGYPLLRTEEYQMKENEMGVLTYIVWDAYEDGNFGVRYPSMEYTYLIADDSKGIGTGYDVPMEVDGTKITLTPYKKDNYFYFLQKPANQYCMQYNSDGKLTDETKCEITSFHNGLYSLTTSGTTGSLSAIHEDGYWFVQPEVITWR